MDKIHFDIAVRCVYIYSNKVLKLLSHFVQKQKERDRDGLNFKIHWSAHIFYTSFSIPLGYVRVIC